MITLCMDESTGFENPQSNADNQAVFIAGLLFNDNNAPRETERERNRILSYY